MDVGLDEPLPLLSLELSGASTSVVYTEHLIDGSHYLFLGTGGGRLLQVRSNVRSMTLCSHYLFLGTGGGRLLQKYTYEVPYSSIRTS